MIVSKVRLSFLYKCQFFQPKLGLFPVIPFTSIDGEGGGGGGGGGGAVGGDESMRERG